MSKKKVAIWGCGLEGKQFVNRWGHKLNICYAIDQNPHIKHLCNIPVYRANYLIDHFVYILITASYKNYLSIKAQLEALGFEEKTHFMKADLYAYQQFDELHEQIESFKNKYDGQRCFLLGNGPSLTLDDLNSVKHEITFACNRIYGFFDVTDWRPTFFFMEDAKAMETLLDTVSTYFGEFEQVFLADTAKIPRNIKNVTVYHYQHFGGDNEMKAQISTAPMEGLFCGATVMFSMLQIAFYMGFKEIYLLGVDMNYQSEVPTKVDYPIELRHLDFSQAYPVEIANSIEAYTVAKKYADENGIKIYNATRGGKLEVFERRKLERILGVAK